MSEINKSFASVNLHPKLIKAIDDMGYTIMTPIQQQAIPQVLSGKDVMGIAQTGTGKTAAFALPLLQTMMLHETASVSPARHPIRALVLVPTRELADQVCQEIKKYAKYTKHRCVVVFGGVDIKAQSLDLRAGADILIATPGRLLDHIASKNVIFNQVEYVVLDEADRMLDIGFLPDLQRILNFLPKQRRTLLFSATFSSEIKKLTAGYLKEPVIIEVARANTIAQTITQKFYAVQENNKRKVLLELLKQKQFEQAYIFTNSKVNCSRLASYLQYAGFNAEALHGNKNQNERLQALNAFKQGDFQYLVATDVAARGLDIKNVPLVFNFDLPFNAEDYVHRIGRTGRAGNAGLAISLVNETDKKLFNDIKKIIQQDFTVEDFNLPAENALKHRSRAKTKTVINADEIKPTLGQAYKLVLAQDDIFDKPYQNEQENLNSSIKPGLNKVLDFNKQQRNELKVPALLKKIE